MFKKLVDGWAANSFVNKIRRKRLIPLFDLMASFQPPVKILDIGGVHHFWLAQDLSRMPEYQITFLNKWPSTTKSELPNSCYAAGDGRSMPEFSDQQFDIVFSNSVIEHVGNYRDQRRMAEEVRRVGKAYYIQTPNRHFPMEPHFHLPYFQYYPLRLRAFLHSRFNLGWWERAGGYYEALEEVESIRLLNKAEFRNLFRDASIIDEKILFLTKSFVACGRYHRG